MENDFVEFIALLNEREVEYVIVGAYAVAYHTFPRATRDIDILISPTHENADRMMEVLKEFGFGSLNVSIDDFLNENIIVQLGIEPVRIDIMSSITGVTIDEVMRNKLLAQYGTQSAWFISLDDLINNKKSTGRLKDLADVENLEQLKNMSKE